MARNLAYSLLESQPTYNSEAGPWQEYELNPYEREDEFSVADGEWKSAGRAPRLASQSVWLPPLPEDEADLFNAGEAGHERIETDALRGLVPRTSYIQAVYFGNWQRDMSQLIVPSFHRIFGARAPLIFGLIFDVVDVLAEAKFGRRLDRRNFGVYRWEEHIDNPREYCRMGTGASCAALDPSNYQPIPTSRRQQEDEPEAPRYALTLWKEGPGALPNYIHASRRYVLRQLGLALRNGPNNTGLEHFGNAMHTVEDTYAHSNFIELGLLRVRGRGDPKTGTVAGSRGYIRDSLSRPRLTTGVFLLQDTLVSLQKLLLHQIEGRPPGQKPSNIGNRIIRVLVRRLLGSTPLAVYDRLMQAWEATGIPALAQSVLDWTGLSQLQSTIEEQIMRPLRLQIASLLRPLVDAAARQTGNKAYPTPTRAGTVHIVEISHSRLAKDDPHHPYHTIARQLATIAVRDFWRAMQMGWSRRGTPPVQRLLDRYIAHPYAAGGWWVPLLSRVR